MDKAEMANRLIDLGIQAAVLMREYDETCSECWIDVNFQRDNAVFVYLWRGDETCVSIHNATPDGTISFRDNGYETLPRIPAV